MKKEKDPLLLDLRGGQKRGNLKKTAAAAALHPSHLSRIETGEIKLPRPDTTKRLATSLQVDSEKLRDYFSSKAGKTLYEQTRLPLEGINLGAQTLEGERLTALLLRGLLSPTLERELYRRATTK